VNLFTRTTKPSTSKASKSISATKKVSLTKKYKNRLAERKVQELIRARKLTRADADNYEWEVCRKGECNGDIVYKIVLWEDMGGLRRHARLYDLMTPSELDGIRNYEIIYLKGTEWKNLRWEW
jgi:hypothetical protein